MPIGRYYQSPSHHDACVRRDKRHVYRRDRYRVCPLNTTHVLLLKDLHLEREGEREMKLYKLVDLLLLTTVE
jgi:hypothetical protein